MTNQPFEVAVNDKKYAIMPSEAKELDVLNAGENGFHILKNQKAYNIEVQSIDYASKTFTFKINGTLKTAKINDAYDRLIDQPRHGPIGIPRHVIRIVHQRLQMAGIAAHEFSSGAVEAQSVLATTALNTQVQAARIEGEVATT